MTHRHPTGAMSRENELLTYLARVELTPADAGRVRELVAESLDWDIVFKRSWWHRIRPLAFRHLMALAPQIVPPHVFADFVAHTDELETRNQRLLRTLLEVAKLFEELQLPAIVFKGPLLAVDGYGDLLYRECGDLDLWIRQSDFPRVADMLQSHGFASWWDQADRKRQVFACEFERADANLDVHWNLAPDWLNYRVDFPAYWEAGPAVLPDGQFFRKLRTEDSLSVLCIHGTKHFWERLRWISDVAELIKRGLVLDWDRVTMVARESRCLRSVYLGTWLSRELLGATLPDDWRRHSDRLPVIDRLGKQTVAWLMHGERTKEARSFGERFQFRMGVCERMRDRVPQVLSYLLGRSKQQAG